MREISALKTAQEINLGMEGAFVANICGATCGLIGGCVGARLLGRI